MKRFILPFISLYALSTYSATLHQAPTPPKKKWQTSLNLYVTAKNLVPYLRENKKAILVDVRTPEELRFTGAASRMNIHVPLYLVDTSRESWNKKKSTWGMMNNKFKEQILIELKKLHANKDSEIFMMCRSGSSRSPKAVNILAKLGYKNVYSVINGFEGHTRKDGNVGARTLNGWKNVGGKWSYKIDPNMAWFDDKYDE
jgi:rhodanese-related sulfurtransferase